MFDIWAGLFISFYERAPVVDVLKLFFWRKYRFPKFFWKWLFWSPNMQNSVISQATWHYFCRVIEQQIGHEYFMSFVSTCPRWRRLWARWPAYPWGLRSQQKSSLELCRDFSVDKCPKMSKFKDFLIATRLTCKLTFTIRNVRQPFKFS